MALQGILKFIRTSIGIDLSNQIDTSNRKKGLCQNRGIKTRRIGKNWMSLSKGTKICNQKSVRSNVKIFFVANVKSFEFSIKNLH